MRSDLTLGAWLAGAVVLHLVLACAATVIETSDMVRLYAVVVAYAVPAGVGLCLAKRLRPWPAAAFVALVVAAHAVAAFSALAMTPTMGLTAAKLMKSGATAGLLGAGLSLFGLLGLRGVRPRPGSLALAASVTAILTAGGLLLVPALDAPPYMPRELGLPVILYLPWQIVFSLAVALVARPRTEPSRAGVRPSPEPATP
jgi:hypothetical protein